VRLVWGQAENRRATKPDYGILLTQVDDLQELNIMLADKLEEWAKGYIAEGKAEGKAEGRAEGEILALQKLLARRFGRIPTEITAKISVASLPEIERWFDRAIDAWQLADVFDGD
jgi:flagellar biosynthesis/type III secretory pathway protein FliH